MQHSAPPNAGTAAHVEQTLDLASALLHEYGVAAAAQVFASIAEIPEEVEAAKRQDVLIQALLLLVDCIAQNDVDEAIGVVIDCPQQVAHSAYEILLRAFFPHGPIDHGILADAALLCIALFWSQSGCPTDAVALLDKACKVRQSPEFRSAAGHIREAFAAGVDEAFVAKLVIWDLDDTLWTGTLAEGDEVVLDHRRVEFVRALNARGIVSAICSKNDPAVAREQLEAFGIWDEFVFPRIAFVPKGEATRQLIADMQLRPANVLFIDDNPHNLNEVGAAVPGIRTVDARSPDCNVLLAQIVEAHAGTRKTRVAHYRTLQAKLEERQHSTLSNEAFLRQSEIRAVVTRWMDNLDFSTRIEELINRSNQLNYTSSRVAEGTMAPQIMDIRHFDTRCIFVWDKYGYYGLVGFAMVEAATQRLLHFAFSCRIMHMGIERFVLNKLAERYPALLIDQLQKPLPLEDAGAVDEVDFLDPGVRIRILAEEAPRDPAKIALRIMCDCQSGALAHFSRHREEIEFDNLPRLFSLPMMATGAYREQLFPKDLVYTAATDYLDWRWEGVAGGLTDGRYVECLEAFCGFVAAGNHRLLVFLPPDNAAPQHYFPHVHSSRAFERSRGEVFNRLWRAAASRFLDHIHCVDLSEQLRDEHMLDANHYVQSVFPKMAAQIDAWYERSN